MKTKILLPTLLLASIFFVQCKKSNDAPLPTFINQVYYTNFTTADAYKPTSFSFQKDGKLKFTIPDNTGSYLELTGTYKINGTNIEINYSLGQKDTTYTITAVFSNDYKLIENGSIKLIHAGNTTEYAKFTGNISFLGDFRGEYNYKQGNTDEVGVIYLNLLEDNTIKAELYLTQKDYSNGTNIKICVGTYHFGNGLLNGSFKNEDGTISFSFQDATITSDGKGANIIEVFDGKLKITINGTTIYGKAKLVPATTG